MHGRRPITPPGAAASARACRRATCPTQHAPGPTTVGPAPHPGTGEPAPVEGRSASHDAHAPTPTDVDVALVSRYEDMLGRLLELADRAFRSAPSWEAALYGFACAAATELRSQPRIARMHLIESFRGEDERLRQLHDRHRARVAEIAGRDRTDGPGEIAAEILIGSVCTIVRRHTAETSRPGDADRVHRLERDLATLLFACVQPAPIRRRPRV